jgi:hypothetical protein
MIWSGADLTWDRFDWGRFDLGWFDLGPILFRADLTCYQCSLSTDWFSVNCGLKQRCPLSPLLFNIFINELTDYLKWFDLGIDIGGENACIFLYADDTERDLQKLLDRLYTWRINDHMTINACKSNVVHFKKT